MGRLHSLLIVGLALIVTVGCVPAGSGETGAGAQSAPAPASGDSVAPEGRTAKKRLVAAIRGDPTTFSGTLSRTRAGRVYGILEIETMLHPGLAVEDDQAELRPVIADAIPTVENGRWQVFPDGRMETTWSIKPGAFWHDGTPLTAEDLVFTMRVMRDRELTEFKDVAYESVDTVDAVDARTLRIRWNRSFIGANTLFTAQRALPLPRHLLEPAYSDDKANLTQLPYWLDEFVGTGPYRLRELVRGSHLILEANPRFILGRPMIDEIEVRFLPDANALLASILAGAVELTLSATGTIGLEQALQIRDQWKTGRIVPVPSGSVGVFPQLLNPSPPVIAEPEFRRALLHAVDRQLLVDTLQGGLAPVAHTHFTPNQPEYKDILGSIVRHEHDPRRAVQLIEGLGYVRGPEGMFRDGAGQPLAIELRSTPGREVNESTAFVVADQWQRVGVAVETIVVPLQRNLDGEYRHTRPGFELGGQPDDPFRLHSSQIPLPANRFVGNNRARYSNPEIDAIIDRYYVTIPRTERVQVLGRFINHITSQAIVMSFFYEAGPLMVSTRLRNVGPMPAWNAHTWELAN